MGAEFNPGQLFFPAIELAIFIATGMYLIWRNPHKGWVTELLAGLLAAGVSAFWGAGAQILYTSGAEIPFFGNGVANPEWIGAVAGGTLGFLAGIWFTKYLRQLHAKGFTPAGIIGRGVAVGIGLGVLCSTLVHILLMTAYRNLNFWPILIGAGFGLAAGLATGLVISIIFILLHKLGLIKAGEPS